ncbi:MAG: peptidase M15 [Desulfovibrionaceae bacterium]|nr:peptidase M15 [Desulfovibrionaceae bacterium]
MNYFSTKELQCKCGCRTMSIDAVFLAKLNMLRQLLNTPLILTSACRCVSHNKKVGGVPTSLHVTTDEKPCTAVDIACTDKHMRYRIIESAIALKFTGIGCHKSFIHLSNNENTKEGVFFY